VNFEESEKKLKHLYEFFKNNLKNEFLRKSNFYKISSEILKDLGSNQITNIFITELLTESFMVDFFEQYSIDLRNPDWILYAILSVHGLYFSSHFYKPKDIRYNTTAPQNRPFHYPATMDNKSARLLINLSAIPINIGLQQDFKKSEVKILALDPFCGQAGIVLELLQFRIPVIASDLDWRVLRFAKANIEYLFGNCVNLVALLRSDARHLPIRAIGVNFIITDLPYGRHSVLKEDFKQLLITFLKSLIMNKIIRPNCKFIFVIASYFEIPKEVEDLGYKIENQFLISDDQVFSRKIVIMSYNTSS